MKRLLTLLLILVLCLSFPLNAEAFSCMVSTQNLQVNGANVNCEKYNIDGSNYFKLRDLAQLMNGTESQFDVGWDAENKVVSITIGHPYTSPNGTELMTGDDQSTTAVVSPQTIMIDGSLRTDLTVYNIGGSNFFKLREMGDALGFEVDFDKETNTAIVRSRVTAEEEPPAEEVVSLELDKSTVSLYAGESDKLTASVSPDGVTVSWRSSDPSIAAVDDNGAVTAFSAGTAAVFATAGSKTASCTVTVQPVEITLSNNAVTLREGESRQLSVETVPAGLAVTWESSNASVASVDASGLVKAGVGGTAEVRAVYGNTKVVCSITVQAAQWYGEGTYRVGTDIPAGDYYAVPTGSRGGYYCKYSDSTQKDIEANDNFDTFTFFRTYSGQYLKLSRCKITAAENAPSPVQTSDSDGYYREGMYRVGVDIPAGDYYAVPTESRGGYYCKYTDIAQKDIEANDNFDTFTFFRTYSGQYLKLNACKIISIDKAPVPAQAPDSDGYYGEGLYRVGIDIPAGEYKILQEGDRSGYYCAYSDITQKDIIKNDNFKGTTYYTVVEGQYLKLHRAKATRIAP